MSSKNFALHKTSTLFIYAVTSADKVAHCMKFSLEASNPTKVKAIMDTTAGKKAINEWLDECQEKMNRFREQFK